VPIDQPPTTETKREPIPSPSPVVASPSRTRPRTGWTSSRLLLRVRAGLRHLLALVLGLGGLVVLLAAITTLSAPKVRATSADVSIAWVALVLGVGLMASAALLWQEFGSDADADGDAD